MTNSCHKNICCLCWTSIQYFNASSWNHIFYHYQSEVRDVEVCYSSEHEYRLNCSVMSVSRFIRVLWNTARYKNWLWRCLLLRNTAEAFSRWSTTHPAPTTIRITVYFNCNAAAGAISFALHRCYVFLDILSFIYPSRDVFSVALGGTRRNGKSKPACLGSQQRRTWPGCIYRTSSYSRRAVSIKSELTLSLILGLARLSFVSMLISGYFKDFRETRWNVIKSNFSKAKSAIFFCNILLISNLILRALL